MNAENEDQGGRGSFECLSVSASKVLLEMFRADVAGCLAKAPQLCDRATKRVLDSLKEDADRKCRSRLAEASSNEAGRVIHGPAVHCAIRDSDGTEPAAQLSGRAVVHQHGDLKNLGWESARERRRFGRFATRLPVATSRDSLAKQCHSRRLSACRLQIQDFSLGGLRAESFAPLKVGEQLTLRLPPAEARPPAEITGRVVHCRRENDRYQVGVEFCQTRSDSTASPWCRVLSLFRLASQFSSAQSGLALAGGKAETLPPVNRRGRR
jgi:hypothetical protein